MKKLAKLSLSLVLCLCMLCSMFVFTASAAGETGSLDFSSYADKWVKQTDEATGVEYYSVDVVYCANPVDPTVQHMAIYVPAAYLTETAAGTVAINPDGKVVSDNGNVYTAETAPILYTNSSGGYSSSVVKDATVAYLQQGYVQVSPGARGKDTQDANGNYIGQFPLLIVDLKAGIRYLKANDALIPGSAERIVSVGASSGGAVSAMLGASGNSPLYDSYLAEIGAADATDDIYIAMCFCPITNLNTADAAYEWFQGNNETYFLFNAMAVDADGNDISDIFQVGNSTFYDFGTNLLGGAHEDELGAVLYNWYVDYIQGIFGEDALGDDGRSGAYWTQFLQLFSDSLTDYLARYDELADKSTYATAADYVQMLVKNYKADLWLDYNAATGKATITDYDAYMSNYMGRNKMCPSLDSYNYKSNEATAFQEADGSTDHFSPVVRDALNTLVAGYLDGSISFDGFAYEIVGQDENGYTMYSHSVKQGMRTTTTYFYYDAQNDVLYGGDAKACDKTVTYAFDVDTLTVTPNEGDPYVISTRRVTNYDFTTGFTEENYEYLKKMATRYTDEVTKADEEALDVMSPVSYVLNGVAEAGHEYSASYDSDLAPYWRWVVGSKDGDQGLPQAWVTHNALEDYRADDIVDSTISLAWGQGHGQVESYTADFYSYLDGVMAKDDGVATVKVVASVGNNPQQSGGTAVATTQTINVNGTDVEFQTYALLDAGNNQTNYIKVRDLASVLNTFNVAYDGRTVLTAGAYEPVGGEMSTPFSGDRAYTYVDELVSINGETVKLSAFRLTDDNGGEYTYYKLRDLASALGFVANWSAERGVYIETK